MNKVMTSSKLAWNFDLYITSWIMTYNHIFSLGHSLISKMTECVFMAYDFMTSGTINLYLNDHIKLT